MENRKDKKAEHECKLSRLSVGACGLKCTVLDVLNCMVMQWYRDTSARSWNDEGSYPDIQVPISGPKP